MEQFANEPYNTKQFNNSLSFLEIKKVYQANKPSKTKKSNKGDFIFPVSLVLTSVKTTA